MSGVPRAHIDYTLCLLGKAMMQQLLYKELGHAKPQEALVMVVNSQNNESQERMGSGQLVMPAVRV